MSQLVTHHISSADSDLLQLPAVSPITQPVTPWSSLKWLEIGYLPRNLDQTVKSVDILKRIILTKIFLHSVRCANNK